MLTLGENQIGLQLPKKWNHEGVPTDEAVISHDGSELNRVVLDRFLLTVPHKMDENVWRSRQQLEEILHLLEPAQLQAAEVRRSCFMIILLALLCGADELRIPVPSALPWPRLSSRTRQACALTNGRKWWRPYAARPTRPVRACRVSKRMG